MCSFHSLIYFINVLLISENKKLTNVSLNPSVLKLNKNINILSSDNLSSNLVIQTNVNTVLLYLNYTYKGRQLQSTATTTSSQGSRHDYTYIISYPAC